MLSLPPQGGQHLSLGTDCSDAMPPPPVAWARPDRQPGEEAISGRSYLHGRLRGMTRMASEQPASTPGNRPRPTETARASGADTTDSPRGSPRALHAESGDWLPRPRGRDGEAAQPEKHLHGRASDPWKTQTPKEAEEGPRPRAASVLGRGGQALARETSPCLTQGPPKPPGSAWKHRPAAQTVLGKGGP